MFTKCLKLTKKSAVIIILIIAVLCIASVILLSSPGCSFGKSELINVTDTEGREKYLKDFGWEIDTATETSQKVLLPRQFDGVMLDYAQLQTDQGYDFAAYCGLECTQYCYEVTNYPDCQTTVYAVLYVKAGHVIGGDIHSAAMDGFMHGIK